MSAPETTQYQPSHLRAFWETDLDLTRADLRVVARRFTPPPRLPEQPSESSDQSIASSGPTRPHLLLLAALITTTVVIMIIRWPATAVGSLTLGIALIALVSIHAAMHYSKVLVQQRENKALRNALRRSQLTKEQVQFEVIREATSPYADKRAA